ncbi:lasso peptide biosynthesis B2 protein [Streptomyces sp. ISL-100]|uniref:lasso peptide biosynthesis B2 protein n=1 Tax=Streptomyces sp. ISL-100 TaxID=2819173 RepID=UPI001BE505F9|nr:lasso peptide biosynthesis B2 protein [Streptomyces sp. ISL-100]MBT2397975.1 lasso peptide biosynthesis B2 protein [Streptomyces sp. ISL-100]
MSIPMAIPPRIERPPLLDRFMAVGTLALATMLVEATPLRATLTVARVAKRCTRRRASASEAVRTVAARDWASRFFPSRAACLEMSLAAFLDSALHGRSVDWCIGCRFDPCESHAWIEACGRPVGEPNTPDRPFHVTLRI